MKPLLYVLASFAALVLGTYAISAWITDRALRQLRWRA